MDHFNNNKKNRRPHFRFYNIFIPNMRHLTNILGIHLNTDFNLFLFLVMNNKYL